MSILSTIVVGCVGLILFCVGYLAGVGFMRRSHAREITHIRDAYVHQLENEVEDYRQRWVNSATLLSKIGGQQVPRAWDVALRPRVEKPS
jgi:hypothetical protein